MSRTPELPSERAERLVRLILDDMDSGAQLPAVKTLAKDLGTTRSTLSRVLHKLEDEGLVSIRHGWGSFKA